MLRNTHLPLFEIFREIVVEKADFTENDTIQVCGNHGKRSHFHKNFVKATFLLNKGQEFTKELISRKQKLDIESFSFSTLWFFNFM